MTSSSDSERIRRALQIIEKEKQLTPNKSLQVLYEEVCLRLDLNPLECNNLYKLIFVKTEKA